jgi:hypothetical protein
MVTPMVSSNCLPAEYCSKGSLADVLSAARKSPQKAALLTWPRRLNLVRRRDGLNPHFFSCC